MIFNPHFMLAFIGELPICNFLFSTRGLFFSTWRGSFSICCNAGLVVPDSCSFCFPITSYFSTKCDWEACSVFLVLPFYHFKYIVPTACRIPAEKSADNLVGIPLYVIYCISLAAFNISSLSLIVSLITKCLGMFLLGFALPGTLCTSSTWVTVSFSMLRKFSAIISWDIFSGPFPLFSFWDSHHANVHLMLQSSLGLC